MEEMATAWIETVEDHGDTYLVNGQHYVPKSDDNRDYLCVVEWLEAQL